MIFSDTSNNLGIIQDITSLTGVDTTNYATKDRTRNINNWYMKVINWIISADGRWQFDDSNQTNQPTAYTDLVADQQDYLLLAALPDTDQDWLRIARVDILDEAGNGDTLYPIDIADITGAEAEYRDVAGTPKQYDIIGNSIFLYPKPSYNKTAGLVVFFQRAPLVFASTDTTKKPGFASIFHNVLSLGAAYDWFISTGELTKADRMKADINEMKIDIMNYYSKRPKYEKPMLRRAYQSFR